MQTPSVLYPPGRGRTDAEPTFWRALPAMAVGAAGAWAVQQYTAPWLGAWREIPVSLLCLYSGGLALAAFFTTTGGTRLLLTDSQLTLRHRWGRQRWDWRELRDIRVVVLERPLPSSPEVAEGTAGILALIPVQGQARAFPEPFQEGDFARILLTHGQDRPKLHGLITAMEQRPAELEMLAEQLRDALHLHHPNAAPLDAAELPAVEQEVRDSLQDRVRRRQRRDTYWLRAATLLFAAGWILWTVRTVGAVADGRSWWRDADWAVWTLAVTVQLTLRKRIDRSRFARPWQTLFPMLVGALAVQGFISH